MSPPRLAELNGEALHHNDVIERHTQLHGPNSPHSGGSPRLDLEAHSVFTGSVSQDQPSSLSSSQVGIPQPSVAATLDRGRSDSPSLGNGNPIAIRRTPPQERVVSDMSHISEHHRNLSGGTISSTASLPSTPPAIQTGFNGPVSPPLPSPPSALDDHGPTDYLTSRSLPGASRLSVFHENTDDFSGSSTRATHNTR